ncbi:hypothetical protein [Streptomyces sp. NPDC006739]|uniref:hypothetical protein n=1 Tax=Streptomyces sp. NPDC006739 TaxID=3364763 RepID=UPI0036B07FCE
MDDDAPRRIQDADELVLARTAGRRRTDPRGDHQPRHRRLGLTNIIGTGITWLTAGTPARFVMGDLICGSLF